MTDFTFDNSTNRYQQNNSSDKLNADKDLMMEQILENINTTPVGRILKKIAALPEVRRKKVLNIRRQLTEGQYDLNERLDVALDKVIEDLTA